MNEMQLWLIRETDALIVASNTTVTILAFLVGFSLLYYLYIKQLFASSRSYIRLVLIGTMLEAFGWGAHRLYYTAWRGIRDAIANGGYSIETLETLKTINVWLLKHSYLSLVPTVVIIVGLGLVITPILAPILDATDAKKPMDRILTMEEIRSRHRKNCMISLWFVVSLFWLIYWMV